MVVCSNSAKLGTQIHIFNANGSGEPTLISEEEYGISDTFPSWAYSDSAIIYSIGDNGIIEDGGYMSFRDKDEIFILASDGTMKERLTTNEWDDFEPDWIETK